MNDLSRTEPSARVRSFPHRVLTLLALALLAGSCTDREPLEPTLTETLGAAQESCTIGIDNPDLIRGVLDQLTAWIGMLEHDGALNSGQALALRNHLENAWRHVQEARPCPVRAQLSAFREQVEHFRRAGHLTDRQMAPLLDRTRMLLGATPRPGDSQYMHAPGVTGELRTLVVDGTEITYEVIDGLAIIHSDMILGYADELEASLTSMPPAAGDEPIILASGVCNYLHGGCEFWTGGIFGYDFANDWGDNNAEMVTLIEAAIDHWRTVTGMEFVRRGSGERAVFRNADGCSSWVGRRVFTGLEPQWINLSATGCNDVDTIIHEIGHAIGLWHEHTRDDRGSFVEIHWNNIPVDRHHNFFHYGSLGRDIGPYDFESIMHYSCTTFRFAGSTANSLDSRDERFTCATIGLLSGLSDGDILGVYNLYRPVLVVHGAASNELGYQFDLSVESRPVVQDQFIIWSSDRVGDLGTGPTLRIRRGDLPVGTHTIGVRVEIKGVVVTGTARTIRIYDPWPSIAITSPLPGARYQKNAVATWFEADVHVHPGVRHRIYWESNLDDQIGDGNGFGRALSAIGMHTIHARVVDEDHLMGATSAPVQIEVYAVPVIATIHSPSDGATFCRNEVVSFSGTGIDPNYPGTVLADHRYLWRLLPSTSIAFNSSFTWPVPLPAGEHVFEMTASSNDPAVPSGSDTVRITLIECDQPPPTVTITRPAADTPPLADGYQIQGYDAGREMWYTDVLLQGHATASDGTPLTGTSLVWTTNQVSLQEAGLGTGGSLTVRLYSNVCEGVWHDIRLTATVGGVSRSALRRINIWSLC